MRLDEQFRKSVVLIGTGAPNSDEAISPWGTGFLVFTEVEGVTFKYVVTAWHVVAANADAPFDIRFNKIGGGAKTHRIENPEWVFHPTDKSIDVAIHEIEVPDWADCTLIPEFPTLLRNDRMRSKNFGAGDRTYTVGLWKFLHGTKRNQPFVYSGNIGLIPEDERVPVLPWLTEHGGERVLAEVYLIEGEPLDGASGSPVFVRRTLSTPLLKEGNKTPLEAHMEGSVWLLGLQSDAFFGRPGTDYEIPAAGNQKIIPRGVNIVVPSMKIAEVLEQQALKEHRARVARERQKKNMPLKTSAASPKVAAVSGAAPAKESQQSGRVLKTGVSAPRARAASEASVSDNPTHKEDFTSLLRAAAKGPAQARKTSKRERGGS